MPLGALYGTFQFILQVYWLPGWMPFTVNDGVATNAPSGL
jgi:hypothetical protein